MAETKLNPFNGSNSSSLYFYITKVIILFFFGGSFAPEYQNNIVICNDNSKINSEICWLNQLRYILDISYLYKIPTNQLELGLGTVLCIL